MRERGLVGVQAQKCCCARDTGATQREASPLSDHIGYPVRVGGLVRTGDPARTDDPAQPGDPGGFGEGKAQNGRFLS